MKKNPLSLLFSTVAIPVLLLVATLSYGQQTIPFTINNNSPFNDNELYVAVVGKNYVNGAHIWIDPRNSQILPMDKSYNTVLGPTYGGNKGPGQNSLYANCFAKLSDIPNKTFNLPPIIGCRVFIAKGSQLYFYFFGSTGPEVGYTAPDHLNPTDPNQNILFEIIEVTNDQYGFFGNTSRVDAFKYPMGLELFGTGGYQKRVGELKTQQEIINLYKANVPSEFQGSVNAAGEIWAPSKTAAFQDGTNGTTPGPQANYLKPYIDAIWEKYKKEDLIFYAGDAGVFKGRVIGERLEVTGISGGFTGRKGFVERRPTTQEALEGKGVLDRRIQAGKEGDVDLVVQAQLTAAINRHVVNVTTPNPGQQNWYDVSQFYKESPMNHYARFWHLPGISIDGLAYGFAYDDVADQSPSLHTPVPTKVIATFGGYHNMSNGSSGVATFYQHCDYAGYAVTLPIGDYTLSQLQSKGIANDDISSLKVQSGYEVLAFNDDFYGGASSILSGDYVCLVDKGLNDAISSIKVRSKTAAFSQTIQAENYSAMQGVQTETTTDVGGGLNVGWTDTGDWLTYNAITIPTSGSYLVEYRVASAVSTASLSLDLNGGTTVLGTVAVPNTGGWQNWTTISQVVTINAGTYDFGIFLQNGGVNLNWFSITKTGSGARIMESKTPVEASIHAPVYVYPNPVASRLFFSTASGAGYAIKIINSSGVVVAEGKASPEGIDVSNLKPGIYSISFAGNGQFLVSRFVKR